MCWHNTLGITSEKEKRDRVRKKVTNTEEKQKRSNI